MDVQVRGLPRTSVLASVLCELSTARPQGSENVPEPDTSAGTRRSGGFLYSSGVRNRGLTGVTADAILAYGDREKIFFLCANAVHMRHSREADTCDRISRLPEYSSSFGGKNYAY